MTTAVARRTNCYHQGPEHFLEEKLSPMQSAWGHPGGVTRAGRHLGPWATVPANPPNKEECPRKRRECLSSEFKLHRVQITDHSVFKARGKANVIDDAPLQAANGSCRLLKQCIEFLRTFPATLETTREHRRRHAEKSKGAEASRVQLVAVL